MTTAATRRDDNMPERFIPTLKIRTPNALPPNNGASAAPPKITAAHHQSTCRPDFCGVGAMSDKMGYDLSLTRARRDRAESSCCSQVGQCGLGFSYHPYPPRVPAPIFFRSARQQRCALARPDRRRIGDPGPFGARAWCAGEAGWEDHIQILAPLPGGARPRQARQGSFPCATDLRIDGCGLRGNENHRA